MATPVSNEAQCIACNRPNTAEPKMVQCDGCGRWYHFSCAGVGDSIEAEDRSYQCALCRPPYRAPSSVGSSSTTASAREARIRLEMQQLEEEKQLKQKMLELEKEFLDRKFKLLQAKLDEDTRSSRASRASDKRSTTSNDKVLHWIDNHQVNLIAKPGKIFFPLESHHRLVVRSLQRIQHRSSPPRKIAPNYLRHQRSSVNKRFTTQKQLAQLLIPGPSKFLL